MGDVAGELLGDSNLINWPNLTSNMSNHFINGESIYLKKLDFLL